MRENVLKLHSDLRHLKLLVNITHQTNATMVSFLKGTNATALLQRNGKTVAISEYNGRSARKIEGVVLITQFKMSLGASRAESQLSQRKPLYHQLSRRKAPRNQVNQRKAPRYQLNQRKAPRHQLSQKKAPRHQLNQRRQKHNGPTFTYKVQL